MLGTYKLMAVKSRKGFSHISNTFSQPSSRKLKFFAV